jgi:hypothetical protein
MVHLAFHHFANPLGSRVTARSHSQDLERVANGSQGVSQLVGKDCEKFVLAAVRLSQSLRGAFAFS